ncbi:MAG TPA: hypothetical protein ENK18_22115 [Deltaproteobacteria bacterium]|nr:hypothetical protein [Deltaproteobacteria bacterium]
MNIYLIPYTFGRHLVMALALAAAGLLAWWWVQLLVIAAVPWLYNTFSLMWSQRADGVLYLGTLVGAVSFAGVLAEGLLRRRPLRWRVAWAALSCALALVGTWLGNGLIALVIPLLAGEGTAALVADPSLVSLRFHVLSWLNAGLWAGLGPFVARRLHAALSRAVSWAGRDQDPPPPAPTWPTWSAIAFSHVGGGLVAGLFGAAIWHMAGHYPAVSGDLYLGSAAAAAAFGGLHGLLCWPIPDDLYAGWIRVLSAERFGLRIPVPHTDGSGAERFVGHFPQGLDLYLPADRGVAELHVSFVVDGDQRYTVRGLSVQPTVVRRALERVDLRYDPARPAPLETELRMEDRIFLGEGEQTVLEFLMLPREEQ